MTACTSPATTRQDPPWAAADRGGTACRAVTVCITATTVCTEATTACTTATTECTGATEAGTAAMTECTVAAGARRTTRRGGSDVAPHGRTIRGCPVVRLIRSSNADSRPCVVHRHTRGAWARGARVAPPFRHSFLVTLTVPARAVILASSAYEPLSL